MNIEKNDPRLTALALGELSPQEASEVESAIEKDPSLRAELDTIRTVADKLKLALAEEPLPKPEPASQPKPLKKQNRLPRRVALYGSAAAVVAMLFVLIQGPTKEAIENAKQIAMKHSTENQQDLSGNSEKMAPVGMSAPDQFKKRNGQADSSSMSELALKPGSPANRVTQIETPSIKEVTRSSGPYTTSQDIQGEKSPAQKTQTGKLMVGVGVNSEAGLVGSIVLDEREENLARQPVNSPSKKPQPGQDIRRPNSTVNSDIKFGGQTTPTGNTVPAAESKSAETLGFSSMPSSSLKKMMPPKTRRGRYGAYNEPELRGRERLKIDSIGTELFRRQSGQFNTEAYDKIVENEFKRVEDHPLSTFSIDVDTASYSMLRRMLVEQGRMPPPGAVRLEELINYFDYGYSPPQDGQPFATHIGAARCPWNEKHNLVRIGLKGRIVDRTERDAANLVFLLDVSGSMRRPNKLPLLKNAMQMLVENLNEKDRVAIVVYAGASGLVLPSTVCADKQKILDALERLQAGGSTNGGAGIRLAYATAAANFIEGGVNRVILCTDGDFNVGTTNQSELVNMIEKKAKEGVFLTVLGFGMGNYKDSTLEILADKGNGNYGYIDTKAEAKKLLVEGLSGTLVTIAKDVKIQVEFNPRHVRGYRLLGYENRMLRKEDFNDDTKDAGEIGAGHTVTALYEIIPADSEEKIEKPKVDELKYQKPIETADDAGSQELLTVKLRYKEPDGDKSKLIVFPMKNAVSEFDEADPDTKFAAAVAAFGMVLRNSEFKGNADYDRALDWAKSSLGKDKFGYREEFLKLVRVAKSLYNE